MTTEAVPELELLCPDGRSYMQYQRECIATAKDQRRILIADEQGLGKTIETIGILNQHPKYRRVLILCPASLCENWKVEIERWSIIPRTIGIPQGSEWGNEDIIILAYTSAWRERYEWEIRSHPWDLVIMDEAHRLRNHKTKQGEAIFGKSKVPGIYGKQVICLTGTPIVNRPSDAWAVLAYLWPDMFGNWFHYVKRYCAGNRLTGHWDVKGASNTEELGALLLKCGMIRRLKRDVLKDLPAKTRQIIPLSPTEEVKRVINREKGVFELHKESIESLEARRNAAAVFEDQGGGFEDAAKNLSVAMNAAFAELAAIRKELGLLKVVWVVEQAKSMLEDMDTKKLVIMAHHQDVIDSICAGLRKDGIGCVAYDGRTPRGKRQEIVNDFQSSPAIQVFVGNMQAAGVGITLTAADRMIFAEEDWVPSTLSQAEDRIHRIGQRGNVLIIHMVFDGSLDAYMLHTIIAKQEVIDSILDPEKNLQAADAPDEIPVVEYEKKPATIWNHVGNAMTLYQKQAAMEGLKFMARLDKDGASARNGVGYSKAHSEIAGKLHDTLKQRGTLTPSQCALAASFLRKYSKQLPEEINEELRNVQTV